MFTDQLAKENEFEETGIYGILGRLLNAEANVGAVSAAEEKRRIQVVVHSVAQTQANGRKILEQIG